jgi:hypothetical protein
MKPPLWIQHYSLKNRAIRSVAGVWLTANVAIALVTILAGVETKAESGLAQSVPPESMRPTLDEVRIEGALRSSFRDHIARPAGTVIPEPKLEDFRREIHPILEETCFKCHGEKRQKADFRVDTLNPDLYHGDDVAWWLEVVDVITNGEMPPDDEEEMPGEDRGKVIEWLSTEIQGASQVRRSEQGHSSFRRMTRYEYNYALQDLLGLPYDFEADLPPETFSEDGFLNSSEMLQMSAMQFEIYRETGRGALQKATVRGERPETLYYGISMERGPELEEVVYQTEFERITRDVTNLPVRQKELLDRLEAKRFGKLTDAHFLNLSTKEIWQSSYNYRKSVYSNHPSSLRPMPPERFSHALIIPAGKSHIFDLGDTLPETGILRIRALISQSSSEEKNVPSLRLEFGSQPSNNSKSTQRISNHDVAILAPVDHPQFYEWDIPLSELQRNPFRHEAKLGDFPNPSEYLVFENATPTSKLDRAIRDSSAPKTLSSLRIDYLEITTPAYDQWPPKSHSHIFIESPHQAEEFAYAREVLANFMPRAWRRPVTDTEIDQHLALFTSVRPECDDFETAMIEVLATVIASPKFLYLVQADPETLGIEDLSDFELATRLSMFLWSSTPDEELLNLATKGTLKDPAVLSRQTTRMLADSRSQRFSKHFVRQWLGMQLFDYLDVDAETYPQFDSDLKEAMQQEPIAFFREILHENLSIMDFLHADYAMVNERLAQHYGLTDVYGPDFQRVKLPAATSRGGLMTQAGLLAMNSDGQDSHPLKRGIWLLERLLNDPPPPPPPAVPEIDLTDPEIAKLTLKERMEDHRNDPACMSCHAKIDPWGIALENFDAVGNWRDEIKGKPVDASSRLFNQQPLDGIDGLKRYLLGSRQDQFAHAMVHKLTTYALGRPLTFGDRASLDELTTKFRKQDDRLGDLIALVVTSELFKTK